MQLHQRMFFYYRNRCLGHPQRDTKRRKVNRNVSVVSSDTNSMCMAFVHMHMKMQINDLKLIDPFMLAFCVDGALKINRCLLEGSARINS